MAFRSAVGALDSGLLGGAHPAHTTVRDVPDHREAAAPEALGGAAPEALGGAAPEALGEVRPLRSVVVVGAGLAGSQAVQALRDQGFQGRIVLVGDEGVPPYDRPPLSKQLLSRQEPAWLADELGTDVGLADDVRLDSPAHGLLIGEDGITVVTGSGPVSADAAVLATGAHAVLPHGWASALTLHTAADAVRLRGDLRPGARLVVVGAGWIGAEVAGVAAAHGLDVTVVEAAAAPLTAALGTYVGSLTVPWYARAGVRLITGAGVVGVTPDAVELADGVRLPAEVVLVAVGARPASAWLGGTLQLAPDGSVPVDERYRVLASNGTPVAGGRLLAVGDLARRRSVRHGWVPGGHWDGALRGPAIAVASLLGGGAEPAPADPAPYVFSTQLGHELALYGRPDAFDEVVLRGDPEAEMTALWFRPGTDELTAVLAVDRPRDVAAARKLFAGTSLPRLDRERAGDATAPLR